MKGERAFDDAARAWATPMPRRRALQVMAGVVIAGAIQPARAAAQEDCPGYPGSVRCGVRRDDPNRPWLEDWLFCCIVGESKCCGHDCRTAVGNYGVCCPNDWTCCSAPHRLGGKACYCCAPGSTCFGNGCSNSACPPEYTLCGSECCSPLERCYLGGCVPGPCPPDAQPCGSDCCAPGTSCRYGKCECNTQVCGGDCCQPSHPLCCVGGFCCTPQRAKEESKALYTNAALEWNDYAASTAVTTATTGVGALKFPKGLGPAVGMQALMSALGWKANAVFAKLAADPPDPNFRVIARPARRDLPKLRTQRPQDQVAVRALAALVRNQADTFELIDVLVISLERAQGAAEAGNREWARRQTLAAARYAGEAATALKRERRLRSRAKRALARNGTGTGRISTDDVRRHQRRVAARGLPPELVTAVRRLGLGDSDLTKIRDAILTANPDRLAGRVVIGSSTEPSMRNAAAVAVELERFARKAARDPLPKAKSSRRRRPRTTVRNRARTAASR